jgi:hypothetical protein
MSDNNKSNQENRIKVKANSLTGRSVDFQRFPHLLLLLEAKASTFVDVLEIPIEIHEIHKNAPRFSTHQIQLMTLRIRSSNETSLPRNPSRRHVIRHHARQFLHFHSSLQIIWTRR